MNSTDPPRVLFIGNSQFKVWDIPRMVQELSQSGRRLLCEGALIGGSWLQTHLDSAETMQKLQSGDWDFVVLQEHYRSPEGDGPQKFDASATEFCERISALPSTPILYASPNIEAEGKAGFEAIHRLNLEFARKHGIAVAGAGSACLKVWESSPDIDLHDDDRAHPNFKASYIGACVSYAALTSQSPIGLNNKCGKSTVSEDEALLFQTAAWEEHQDTNKEILHRCE